jgi:hypothetical protein
MFRQPGMSRRPTGILASSPQLANTVANRQPVRMANGGANTVNRGFIPDMLSRYATQSVSGSGDANERAFRSTSGMIPLAIESLANRFAAPDVSGSADANERAFRSGEVKPQLGNISEKLMNVLRKYPKSGFAKGFLEDLVLRSREEQDAVADKLEQQAQGSSGISSLEALSGLYADGMGVPNNVTDAAVAESTPQDKYADKGSLPSELTTGVMSGGAPRFNPDGMSSQEDLGRGSRESDIMGSKDDTQFFGPGETLSNEIVDFEINPNKKDAGDDVEGQNEKGPKVSKPAIDVEEPDFEWATLAADDPEEAMGMLAKAQSSDAGDGKKTDKTKAKETDSILNIKSIKERKEFLRNLLGESKAKDIRTDANYNLMMTGLMIAAGESPNAMTNIAKGLAGGLKGYGDAVGEEAKEERKIDRELGLLAYQDVEKREAADRAAEAAEKSELRKIEAAATEADKQRVFLTSQNSLSFLNKKELAELGFTNQLKIAELSTNSRELIAKLGRENQKAIAKLPKGEIAGLLEIFEGDKEGVKAYLERKKSTSGPQAKSGERKADDLEELITKDERRISRIRGELKKRIGRKPTEAEIQNEIRTIARAGIAEFLPKTDDGGTSDTPGGFTVTKQK